MKTDYQYQFSVNENMKPNSRCIVLIILVEVTAVLCYGNETVYDQLSNFAKSVRTPAILTTSSGFPVPVHDTQTFNYHPLLNNFFIESLTQMNRERIPDRIAHGKGSGAFGYFQVTKDLKDICKAKVFDTAGKVTKLVARFSPATQRIGGSDLIREHRGFALKLYTEEGNLDLLALNVDMFQIKDPIFFATFVHSFDKNPRTGVLDPNAIWDFLTLRPESLSMYMRIFGDHGIPNGYRYMYGWTIHTFELLNNHGNRTYVRFHFRPVGGVKNLTSQEAQKIQGEDLDYFTRDLYEAIQNKNYPSWTIHIQTIAEKDVNKAGFDIFDVTKYWPMDKYPLRDVGKVVLNRNPENYFADIEQVAFNPGNLVSGIRGVDSLFETRVLLYRDSHHYRLGKNFNRIAVNCPLLGANTYDKDGRAPVLDNGDGSPTYYPNSFKGPMPLYTEEPERISVFVDPKPNNFDQAGDIYRGLNTDEKCRLVENIVASLRLTKKFIQDRAVGLYKLIDRELSQRIEKALKMRPSKKSACRGF